MSTLAARDVIQQTTSRLGFRDFNSSDYERLVEIYNANYPDYPTSVEETRYNDESSDKSKFVQKRFPCVDQDSGSILAFARLTHTWWNFHPQKFMVDIVVDPQYQRRGGVSRSYERLTEELEKLHAKTAWASVKENMPRSFDFATKRGFVEKQRLWESRLVPSELDSASFEKYSRNASKDGIRISTFAEEEVKGPEFLKELYELVQDCWADVPLPVPYTRVSYEQWEEKELKNPSLVRDGFFIASDGPRLVGYSNVWHMAKEPRTLYQAMTGVRREYRGRGVAMVLKLRVIDYARQNRYDVIKTWNDSANTPILAANTKLGFKREVGWITMEKTL